LRAAVDQIAPDVVHSNGLKTHLLLWAARSRAPIVWHLHDFVGQRRAASRLLRWTSGRARRAIAISQPLAADARPVLPRTPTAAPAPPGLALRFFVVGGPIYHTAGSQWSGEELRTLAAQAGIARRVGFVPFQPDPVAAYRGLDVVVHASTQPEPFGLTIV